MWRERREGREHAPKELRGGRRGEGVVLAHYQQQCPGGGGRRWGVSGGADVEGRGGGAERGDESCSVSVAEGAEGAARALRRERSERVEGGLPAGMPCWRGLCGEDRERRGRRAARTGSSEDGERRGRRHLGERRGRRERRGWRAARTKSGENGESSEVHLTRPEGGTCGGGWGRAEGSERWRGRGAWRAVHAQERAWK